MSAALHLAQAPVDEPTACGRGTSFTRAVKSPSLLHLQALRSALLLGLFLLQLPLHAAEVLDRIVALVNGHIILQSDWDDAIRYEAFMDNRLPASFSPADRKAALDRLIDQELLREQMRSSDLEGTPREEDIVQRIAQIRTQYAATDASRWQAVLEEHGISEGKLKQRVAVQLGMLRLVDERLRPTIQIDSKTIESYYQQSLLPQLRLSGAAEVPLADVTPKIKELLTQQKLDQLLTAWLQSLRATSQIRTQTDPRDEGLLQ